MLPLVDVGGISSVISDASRRLIQGYTTAINADTKALLFARLHAAEAARASHLIWRWQGYSRAADLHLTAQLMSARHAGHSEQESTCKSSGGSQQVRWGGGIHLVVDKGSIKRATEDTC